MIAYVDTSTLLKLVVEEAGSDAAAVIWDAADALASVGLVVAEARAALAAARRAGRLTEPQHPEAKQEVAILIEGLHLVEVTDDLITAAADLAEAENLRGYDAVHLAGALLVGAEVLTSADDALCEAASAQGLHIANPLGRSQDASPWPVGDRPDFRGHRDRPWHTGTFETPPHRDMCARYGHISGAQSTPRHHLLTAIQPDRRRPHR